MESPPPAPMQSPLAVFLYLLMRDHLPVATVKWMLEQAKLAGDPKFDAPELEALAQRFAEQLGHLTERPADGAEGDTGRQAERQPDPPAPPPAADPPPPPEPPAKEPRAKRSAVGAETLERARAWMREQGRPIRPGEVDEGIGVSSVTRSLVIRTLAAEGFLRIEGHSQSRRLIVVDQGEDPPAADPPPDPPEDPPPPAPDPPAAEEEDEEDDTKPPRSPARPGETDVELMARVSDYIKEATARNETVWPRELEEHFGLNRERRQRIIEMLAQRQRIIVRKPNSPHVHYVYRQGSGDPDFRFEHDDEAGLGGGKVHLTKDPDVDRRVAAIRERDATDKFIVSEHMETIRAWARGPGNFTARQVQEVFKVSPATSHRVVSTLLREGAVESVGQDGRTGIYAVKRSTNGASGGGAPGKRPLHAGGDGSTLDGRALGLIQGSGGLTPAELGSRLGVTEDVARAVLGKLYGEGEVRPQRDEGTTRYVAV